MTSTATSSTKDSMCGSSEACGGSERVGLLDETAERVERIPSPMLEGRTTQQRKDGLATQGFVFMGGIKKKKKKKKDDAH